MINLKRGALAIALCLFALVASANEGIQGTWFRVADGARPVVESAEYIMVMKPNGQLVEIFIDPSNRMKVFTESRFEVAGKDLTFAFPDRGRSHHRIGFEGEDTLILSSGSDRSIEFHALTGKSGLWSAAVKLAEIGEVRSIQLLDGDGRHILGAPKAAQVYLDAAPGSILLLGFEGSQSEGAVTRRGHNWLVPVSRDVVALALGPESFLPRFERLVERISSR